MSQQDVQLAHTQQVMQQAGISKMPSRSLGHALERTLGVGRHCPPEEGTVRDLEVVPGRGLRDVQGARHVRVVDIVPERPASSWMNRRNLSRFRPGKRPPMSRCSRSGRTAPSRSVGTGARLDPWLGVSSPEPILVELSNFRPGLQPACKLFRAPSLGESIKERAGRPAERLSRREGAHLNQPNSACQAFRNRPRKVR